MSGLCSDLRRVSFSFRQEPFAPRMIRCRLDRALREVDRWGISRAHRTRGDGLMVEPPALMGDASRPIPPFFHQYVGRPDIGLDLIELPVVRHGPIAAQDSGGLQTQHAVEISFGRNRPMQIGALRRLHGKALVVPRQIGRQPAVRGLERRDPREPQLLAQPILAGGNQPLHPALGLRRVGVNHLDAHLREAPLKLTLGLAAFKLLLHRRLGWRLVGRMLVRVDR